MLDVMGHSLADAAGMLADTLWALVLGFALSGLVQAFVSRERMQQLLGNHRPAAVTRATLFGAASSSCSYAAAALAKTLFARGADLTTSLVFMVASTNLVVELGAVLWLLLGWQFALAEVVGGVLMVTLLAVFLPRALGGAMASARAQVGDPDEGHGRGETRRLSTREGWLAAAGYAAGDLWMLRRELVIGFVVAGFADAAVPVAFWRHLFLTGHGFPAAVENVVLGPFLAVISFVCSVGNVPLAASLWSGGATFGGVVAFVFADLITIPLLLIYRRYYGTRVTLRILGVFWAVMSVTGLAVDYLFRALGIAATSGITRHGHVGRFHVGANATTVLDAVSLVVLAVIVVASRRPRRDADSPYAVDPVCGMQVEKAHAPHADGHWFCSDGCRDSWVSRDPAGRGRVDATT